jgi:hypothetical protein
MLFGVTGYFFRPGSVFIGFGGCGVSLIVKYLFGQGRFLAGSGPGVIVATAGIAYPVVFL